MQRTVTIPDLSRLLRPEAVIQFATAFAMALVSIWTTPGSMPGSDTTLTVLAALLAGIALAAALAIDAADDATTRQAWLALTAVLVGLAVVLAFVVRPAAGLVLLGILAAVLVTQRQSAAMARLTLVALTPWWIWMAADSWRWQLLMLVPLHLLVLVGIAQLHDATSWPENTERIMSARAHRSAGWFAIALAGVLLVTAGLLTHVGKPWVALAGVSLAVAIPLEASLGAPADTSAQRSTSIVATAAIIASISWLIGIA